MHHTLSIPQSESVFTLGALSTIALGTLVGALGAVLHAFPVFCEAEPVFTLPAVAAVTVSTVVGAL